MSDHAEFQGSGNAASSVSPRAPRARTEKSRRRRRVLIVLGSLGLILALIVGVGAVYMGNLKSSFESKSDVIEDVFPDSTARPAKKNESVNILLLGSDKRAQPVDPSKAVAGGGADERTDSIMLVNISGDRQHVTVMSIMRDLWVDIPGHGQAKINAGYAYGGRKLEVQTIENLLQTRIDHVALVDMESFKEFGNALGGLDVNVEKTSTLSSLQGKPVLQPGLQHLTGEQALAFSRERYSYANGDYQRVRNQQAVIRSIVNKLISKETLTNPAKVKDVVDLTSPFISRDASLDFSTIAGLAFDIRNIRPSDIRFATMPTAGTGWSADRQSIVLVDEKGLASVQKALQEDSLNAWLDSDANHEKG